MTDIVHTFAGNPLDRGDALRRDADWLAAAARDPDSRYVPMWRMNVLIEGGEGDRLGWLPPGPITELELDTPPVFLGLAGTAARFAQDVSGLDEPLDGLKLSSRYRFEDCRAAGMVLPGADAGIVAQCRSQLAWHERHQFCSVCGARSMQAPGGHLRVCLNATPSTSRARTR